MTKDFPYVNGGLKGVVDVRGDEIRQPKGEPIRPALRPLHGAVITGFERNGDEFKVVYEMDGEVGQVQYSILDEEKVEFTYLPPNGRSSTVVYQRGKSWVQRLRGNLIWGVPVLLASVAGPFQIAETSKTQAS